MCKRDLLIDIYIADPASFRGGGRIRARGRLILDGERGRGLEANLL